MRIVLAFAVCAALAVPAIGSPSQASGPQYTGLPRFNQPYDGPTPQPRFDPPVRTKKKKASPAVLAARAKAAEQARAATRGRV